MKKSSFAAVLLCVLVARTYAHTKLVECAKDLEGKTWDELVGIFQKATIEKGMGNHRHMRF